MHKILEVKKERRKLTTLSMTSYSVIKAGKGKVSYEIKHFLEIVPLAGLELGLPSAPVSVTSGISERIESGAWGISGYKCVP